MDVGQIDVIYIIWLHYIMYFRIPEMFFKDIGIFFISFAACTALCMQRKAFKKWSKVWINEEKAERCGNVLRSFTVKNWVYSGTYYNKFLFVALLMASTDSKSKFSSAWHLSFVAFIMHLIVILQYPIYWDFIVCKLYILAIHW